MSKIEKIELFSVLGLDPLMRTQTENEQHFYSLQEIENGTCWHEETVRREQYDEPIIFNFS